MLFFLRLANALKQFDLPSLGLWSALAFMRNRWNRLACPHLLRSYFLSKIGKLYFGVFVQALIKEFMVQGQP